jgi:hypothetical protein
MILVRQTFQASFGNGGALARAMVENSQAVAATLGERRWRVLTDLSGPFDTVVLEIEAASLADWEHVRGQLFASPELAASMASTAALIVSGSSALYTIEGQS